ncbi:hypothetical protein L1856_04885 [Streptomyces sp. Tue 6430]|nr:hypothetical protein [Streptomyces sp. Tue 6430]
MFVDLSQGERIARGQDPVERPVFLKPHGTARGTLTVRADLPDELRDAFVTAGALPEPTQVSFTHDILSILRRLCDLQ